MVRLTKKLKRSLYIEIDKTGAKDLINYLSKNLISINITHNDKKKKFIIFVKEGANNILINDELVKLELDEEEKDFFLQRLHCCIQKNSFYPAELCEREMKNRTISIYVFYIDE